MSDLQTALQEDRRKRNVAHKLLGKPIRFHHMKDGAPMRLESIEHDGMVTLVGWIGEFDPGLFYIVQEEPS